MIAAETGAGTTELHVLRARTHVDPRWVLYAVRSNHFLAEGVTAYEGVAGLRRVPAEFVNSFRVADLPIEKQRRIADFLDDRVGRIEEIISARRLQIDLGEAARRSAVSEGFLRFASGRIQVKRLLHERPAYGLLPDTVGDNPGDPRYIRTTDIDDRGLLRPDTRVTVDGAYLQDFALREGDVLIARSGSIGKCLVLPPGVAAVFAGYLVRLRFERISPRAFWYFAKSDDFMDQLMANAVQSTILNFNADRYASMWMPDVRGHDKEMLRLLDEQFADFDRIADCQGRSLELLGEYKQSLITAAVTDQLDVTTASTSIPPTTI